MPEAGDSLRVAVAQIAPVWLDRDATLAKVLRWIEDAADAGAQLVVFGEALVPGYPFWVERTDGARFDSALQKRLYAHYLDQGVCQQDGDLASVQALAARRGIAVYLGVVERARDRSGHTLYCALVYVDGEGVVGSVHRKLVPTYEERLVWGNGDGHGLRTHRLGPFTVGGLNCWENWLPLARASLQGQGEDLHIAVWPGSEKNTADITRFAAREGRSWVVSVSGLMRREDIPDGVPEASLLRDAADDVMANGGSAVAAPDGSWLLPPVVGEEALRVVDLDAALVREARQNMDVAGHYSRPDVTRLVVDRRRQSTVDDED